MNAATGHQGEDPGNKYVRGKKKKKREAVQVLGQIISMEQNREVM